MSEENKTKKEIAFDEFVDGVYMTTMGKMTLKSMLDKFNPPLAVLEYAKIEVRTGMVSNPTAVVERDVDRKLVFDNGIVIKGIPKGLFLLFDVSGYEKIKVRMPNYNPIKMPKIKKQELNKLNGN